MSFRTFILPWILAAIAIGAIESSIYAIYRPSIVERNDFLVQPIQSFLSTRAERWIIWTKVRKMPDESPIAVQAGDSSGFYGIMPDVVSQYIGGKQLLDLSCCANQGFHGYMVLLELALQKYRSLRYAVVYVSPTVPLDESQWVWNPPDTVLSPGVLLPMLASAMHSNYLSYRKYLYPPSNALRPNVYERVMLRNQVQPIPPQERQPNTVFARSAGMYARNGYMIEHDLQIDIPGGCVPVAAPRDPETGKTYWELFAQEFVALANKYNVTPVIIFAPTSFAACDLNREFTSEIARLRQTFPSLKIPYDPLETWPSNFFSVPAHVQRTFAIEASRRVGRALRALEQGKELAENLAIETAPDVEPRMHVIGATLTEECGWSPDYKNGYFGDVTEAVRAVCDGKTACSYQEGSDARDRPPPQSSCKGVYIVDYKCDGQPVRSLRQEGRLVFGGNIRLDCRQTAYLARDPMPYGIQIAYATFSGSSGGVIGNATTPIAIMCQGLVDCRFAIDVTKLGGSPSETKKSLEILYRCDRELVTRVISISDAETGKIVNFGCTGDLNPASEPISVVSATDGKECGASRGNADYAVSTLCDGKDSCDVSPMEAKLSAIAPSCATDMEIQYRCGAQQEIKMSKFGIDKDTPNALLCRTDKN